MAVTTLPSKPITATHSMMDPSMDMGSINRSIPSFTNTSAIMIKVIRLMKAPMISARL